MRVGLTGGVGSGKTTVARLFAAHGAVVIDADQVAREVVEPGTPGYDAVVARFGPDVVGADGALDRPALAALVFGASDLRADLNAIVHPLVGARVAELTEEAGAATMVYDVPLLVENDMADGFDVVVVVVASETTRMRRLAERGMSADDARARMASQAGDEQRRAVADIVIDNDGSLDELRRQVDEAWATVVARA